MSDEEKNPEQQQHFGGIIMVSPQQMEMLKNDPTFRTIPKEDMVPVDMDMMRLLFSAKRQDTADDAGAENTTSRVIGPKSDQEQEERTYTRDQVLELFEAFLFDKDRRPFRIVMDEREGLPEELTEDDRKDLSDLLSHMLASKIKLIECAIAATNTGNYAIMREPDGDHYYKMRKVWPH